MTNPFVQTILATLFASSSAFAIIGGEDVSPDSDLAKKAVMIMNQSSKKTADSSVKYYSCSGSLIARNIVLTAAHCFPESKLKTVVLFGNDPLNDLENGREQSLKVKKVIQHPQYVEGRWDHDIALIVLEKDAPTNFRSMALSFSNEHDPHRSYTVAGYSSNAKSEEFFEYHKLRTLETQIRTAEPITPYWQFIVDGPIVGDQASLIMTDEQSGAETVEGDSGGPLMLNQNGEYVLIAINSFWVGTKDIKDKWVGKVEFYTKISKYKNWLLKTLHHLQAKDVVIK